MFATEGSGAARFASDSASGNVARADVANKMARWLKSRLDTAPGWPTCGVEAGHVICPLSRSCSSLGYTGRRINAAATSTRPPNDGDTRNWPWLLMPPYLIGGRHVRAPPQRANENSRAARGNRRRRTTHFPKHRGMSGSQAVVS